MTSSRTTVYPTSHPQPPHQPPGVLLSVRDLNITFPSEAGRIHAVRGIDFDLRPGRTLAIVGESGSGKSVTSLAVMGLLPQYAKVSGSVVFDGEELITKSDKEMSALRGNEIGMIFQDPLSSLTPVFTIGSQIVEAIRTHNDISAKQAWKQAEELLDLVGISEPHKRARSFPHEFSGGMRQRASIAMAIANKPRLLIADEPTTALDVTMQAQVLDVLKLAQNETGAATIIITHDMGVVATIADDVMVMYAGKSAETASARDLFRDPRMPYTVGLLGATPRIDGDADQPLIPIQGAPPLLLESADLSSRCQFAARCPIAVDACTHGQPESITVAAAAGKESTQTTDPTEHRVACTRAEEIRSGQLGDEPIFPLPEQSPDVFAKTPRDQRPVVLKVNGLSKSFPLTKGALLKRKVGTVQAVNNVSFDLRQGECLAIVGESGSGKSTTLMEIMSLNPSSGTVELNGVDTSTMSSSQRRAARKDIQIVFQDPMSSLNPRMTIKEILSEPLTSLGYDGSIDSRVAELMELVGLDPGHVDRFPSAFSGGQRQRIGLARALASNPKVIVLDEPVSALDVSIQAGVINLLADLRRSLGLSYIFVSHDLSVVRHLSDRVAVMYKGEFVEHGNVDEIFTNPQHDYTLSLLEAVPIPDPDAQRHRSHKDS